MKLLKLLLPVLFLEACLPAPKDSTSDSVAPGLLITGNLESDQTLTKTEIFLNNEVMPVAVASGSAFEFALSNEKLQQIRQENGGQDGPLRLYFYSENKERVAVSTDLKLTSRGRATTGVLALLPEVTLSGTISTLDTVDNKISFEKDALVWIGRNCGITNANGYYEVKAPQEANLPLMIEKKGFVRSEGTWHTDNLPSSRNLQLYKTLSPTGVIEIKETPRAVNAKIRLMVSGNAMSRFVRIAVKKESLTGSANAEAPWLSLDDALFLPTTFMNQAEMFYQFADESRTAIGPILSLAPPKTL